VGARSSLLELVRVAQLPEPLVRCHQGFHVVPPSPFVRYGWEAVQRHLQDVQQSFGDLEIGLVAGLMEGDQDLVG